MTKIAYNARYGGFGLSHAALMRYAELKGITLTWEPMSPTMADSEFWRHYYNGEEHFSARKIPRTDPHLIQVIEELGEKASGAHANLAIAEVPAGTKYRIDEYDGAESVMTEADYEWSIA